MYILFINRISAYMCCYTYSEECQICNINNICNKYPKTNII